jgi:diguanylate cyclase (GGDEF)-like protein
MAKAAWALTLLCALISCKQVDRQVVVGVDNSPPFYIFQPDGSVRGLAVEVLSEAARRSNIRIRWVPLTNFPLDKALASRTVQMWPAVGATPDRKAKYYLSEPWITSEYVLVSRGEKPVRRAVDAVGLKVAFADLRLTATIANRYLSRSQFVILPSRTKAVQEMCAGRADAAVIESRMIEPLLLHRPPGCIDVPLNIAHLPGADIGLCIAAVPEVAGLASQLRSEISKMVVNGEFETIVENWSPFSAEIARSIGVERSTAVRNWYLMLLSGVSLSCATLLGFVAHRANKHHRSALEAKEEIRRQAARDSLTGLANRSMFTERVARCIVESQRDRDSMFGLFFLDLDYFKVINDSLGHMAGDQLLIEIARRLTRTVHSCDTIGRLAESCVARLGGDEFAILIENIQSVENARRIAERIQRDMSTPFLLENRSVVTTFSIGVALSSGNYQSAEGMLRDADIAMYAAKSAGKARFAIFDPAMRARAVARLEIESDLRRALESRELVLYYQPEVDLDCGKIIGFEALVRWLHPNHGVVAPLDFIPIAEETGLIGPLGAWVLEEACCQISRWQLAFPEFSNLRISVNLSGKQLTSKDLIRDVENALETSGLRAGCLDLEITESVLMDEAAIQMLPKLKALGLGLQIDDFGTGYSSLSYLHRLPFDTLKIDRSFIRSMDTEEDGVEIVRTIMALAQNLKMSVVAEGVENRRQLLRLREMGCALAQGYHFSKPLDPAGAEKLLGEQSRVGRNDPELALAG